MRMQYRDVATDLRQSMRKVELFDAIQLSTLLEIGAFVATGRSGP